MKYAAEGVQKQILHQFNMKVQKEFYVLCRKSTETHSSQNIELFELSTSTHVSFNKEDMVKSPEDNHLARKGQHDKSVLLQH